VNPYRRQQGIKRAARVAKIFRAMYKNFHDTDDEYRRGSRWFQGMIKTRKPCSCGMCGKKRQHMKGDLKLTMQERRFDNVTLDDLEGWRSF
jgi:hypothetical protein